MRALRVHFMQCVFVIPCGGDNRPATISYMRAAFRTPGLAVAGRAGPGEQREHVANFG